MEFPALTARSPATTVGAIAGVPAGDAGLAGDPAVAGAVGESLPPHAPIVSARTARDKKRGNLERILRLRLREDGGDRGT